MAEVELSVIVPVYNTGNFVNRCLNSLISQSYKNLEIIVVNDGSKDNSHDVISKFLLDNRIKYINLETNKGLGNARNIGINEAKGRYVTFVDSDDWVDLDSYRTVLENLIKDDADIAIFGIKNEWDNSIDTQIRYSFNCDNKITAEQGLNLLTKFNQNNFFISPVVWNKVYKKELLLKNNIEFLHDSYWEDDIFSFEVMLNSNYILLVSDIYYHYYQRSESITNTLSKKHIDDLIFSFAELKKYLIDRGLYEKYIGQFRAMFDRCITTLINMIYHNEQSIIKQKKYLIYFYEKFTENFSFKEAIEYLDHCRIKRLFSN